MTWDTNLESRLRHRYLFTRTSREVAKDYSAEQRRKMADKGHALPDGSFPIADSEDVKNAVKLAKTDGHRKHIIKRARAVGATHLIPSDWIGQKAYALAEGGFCAEIGGKVLLTAPARTLSLADELPAEMREKWERASTANPYFMWLSGRFVEAERANRNGALWTTQDLQFGEMSVRNGPLNWLHDARKVVGSIADNKLITPTVQQASDGPRPFIAANAAMWKWLYPGEAKTVEQASDSGNLFFSMECVAKEVACTTDGHLTGCGASFPYMTAMTSPDQVCEHIRTRSAARRMVEPSFLGGAVIVPPVRPGWGEARAEVMRQASELAAQAAPADASATQWELLMAAVISYAMGTS